MRPEDFTDHLLDMTGYQLDGELDALGEAMCAVSRAAPVTRGAFTGPKLGIDLVSLSEYAPNQGLDEIDCSRNAPKGMCSYCGSTTRRHSSKSGPRRIGRV